MAQSLSTLSSIAGSDDWRQRARNALSWLREKYVRLRNYKITPENILREGTRANFPLAGRMYFYSYDPKTKNKLVHYDTFPLVIPIEKYSATKFLGINFHYLPYSLRTQLMNNVMEQVNIEEEKFELQYSDIKGANNMNLDSIFITSGVHKSKTINESLMEKLLVEHKVSANYFQKELTW